MPKRRSIYTAFKRHFTITFTFSSVLNITKIRLKSECLMLSVHILTSLPFYGLPRRLVFIRILEQNEILHLRLNLPHRIEGVRYSNKGVAVVYNYNVQ